MPSISQQAAPDGISFSKMAIGSFIPAIAGAWESAGQFLEKSPHEDILDIIADLPKEIEEIAFGRRFRLLPDQFFVIGGSFGGAAAILASLDPRVNRVIANCPVVDWNILDRPKRSKPQKRVTPNISGKRLGTDIVFRMQTGKMLRSGTFYNPWHHLTEITASKVMIFHAKDDPHVPYEGSRHFSELTGVALNVPRTRRTHQHAVHHWSEKYWTQMRNFSIPLGARLNIISSQPQPLAAHHNPGISESRCCRKIFCRTGRTPDVLFPPRLSFRIAQN